LGVKQKAMKGSDHLVSKCRRRSRSWCGGNTGKLGGPPCLGSAPLLAQILHSLRQDWSTTATFTTFTGIRKIWERGGRRPVSGPLGAVVMKSKGEVLDMGQGKKRGPCDGCTEEKKKEKKKKKKKKKKKNWVKKKA